MPATPDNRWLRKRAVNLIIIAILLVIIWFVKYRDESGPETLANLMAAATEETQANADYLVFADVAEREGQKEISTLFRAIAEAKRQHASDEFALAQNLGAVEWPVPHSVTPGTTHENLQAALTSETEEHKKGYSEFIAAAQKENMPDAARLFALAKQAEEIYARLFSDVLKNYDQIDSARYAQIFRCPICGAIELAVRPATCSLCDTNGAGFIEYD
ncbi:MAG: rubrerythrin family protein [Peptococcaceae bacterium]|nr:rubrerythrin family protein [Peptococcaceae bacterium]